MLYLRPQRDSKKYQRSFEEYEKSLVIQGMLVTCLKSLSLYIEGEGGQNQPFELQYIFVRLGNPGMMIQPPQMEFWNDVC